MSLVPLQLTIVIASSAELTPPPAAVLSMIVETGVGRPDANTYVSLEQAKAYFIGKRLHSSAWNAARSADKETALRQASMLLDAEFKWSGRPLNPNQGLGWPRLGATDKHDQPRDRQVPNEIKNATCELALYLLDADRLQARQGVGMKRVRVDVIEIEYSEKGGSSPETYPSYVARMVNGLGEAIRGRKTMQTVRLRRT